MTGILPLTPPVLRAYRASSYHVGRVVVRIGRCPAGNLFPDEPRTGDIVLLSACNPGGRLRPARWNARMMTALLQRLHGVPHVVGVGRLGRWSEPLVAAALPLQRGVSLARVFRQNAVVLLRADQPARLIPLGSTVAKRG